jgi:DNA-binding IclR family transcriptional regulator
VSDIGEELGLTNSLVSRLLATLEHEGFVERDVDTGQYQLGPTVLSLAGVSLNHNRIRAAATREMQVVAGRLGLGVNLSVLHHDSIFYLGHVDSPDAPRPYTLLGRKNPLNATGMGKVLLANLPSAERARLLDALPLVAYTEQTITDRTLLTKELEAVRRRGWALERDELALGRACIAGPIRDASGSTVAAMSFSGANSAFRWDERRDELTSAIIEVTDSISTNLGYVTAPPESFGATATQPVTKQGER